MYSERQMDDVIIIGADHGGFRLKEAVKQVLAGHGYAVRDVGTDSEESVDYPPIARAVARHVAAGGGRGILVCGSGNGVAIAANKTAGVRAVNAHDPEEARLAREHNDINVLTLAGRRLSAEDAGPIITAFLETDFGGGGHDRRVQQLEHRARGTR